MHIKTRFLVILTVISLFISGFVLNRSLVKASAISEIAIVKTFTSAELSKFDGTNSTLPIYLAMNGNVYDVTAGRDFYQTGGAYHYLAGRDSSAELNLVGGGIIKAKYPVVGKLSP